MVIKQIIQIHTFSLKFEISIIVSFFFKTQIFSSSFKNIIIKLFNYTEKKKFTVIAGLLSYRSNNRQRISFNFWNKKSYVDL